MTAPQFHQLKVSEVTHLTDDSVAVTFEIPDDLDTKFDFIPGQHVTVRAVLDDVDTRRSYSICCPPGKAQIQVGIRRIPDGAFSTFATTQLSPGDVLDVMPPGGDFFLRQLPAPSHLVAIAAGSGITPVLSILTTALADPSAEATLVYGNRTSSSIMFLEELEGLKDKHPTRFNLIHVLSREPQSVELFTGRIDQGQAREAAEHSHRSRRCVRLVSLRPQRDGCRREVDPRPGRGLGRKRPLRAVLRR